jgi:hypothetical protein
MPSADRPPSAALSKAHSSSQFLLGRAASLPGREAHITPRRHCPITMTILLPSHHHITIILAALTIITLHQSITSDHQPLPVLSSGPTPGGPGPGHGHGPSPSGFRPPVPAGIPVGVGVGVGVGGPNGQHHGHGHGHRNHNGHHRHPYADHSNPAHEHAGGERGG